MKKIVSLAMCVAVVLMVSGVAMAAEGKGPKGPKGPDFFTKVDANKDGKLSLDEFKAAYKGTDAEAKFLAADTDKDGFLTKEELKAAHGKGHKHADAAPAPAAQ